MPELDATLARILERLGRIDTRLAALERRLLYGGGGLALLMTLYKCL